jgi:hypothetical protein
MIINLLVEEEVIVLSRYFACDRFRDKEITIMTAKRNKKLPLEAIFCRPKFNHYIMAGNGTEGIRGSNASDRTTVYKLPSKDNVAYFGAKINPAFSPGWRRQKRQKATIQGLCCQLEDLRERLRGGSRGVSVGRVDVGKGGIERAVPEVLADQKGIRALLDHQHRGGMLENMWVL